MKLVNNLSTNLLKFLGRKFTAFAVKWLTNIHPSKFSVIIAVDFLPEQMSHQSFILPPIMDYFANTKVDHSIKVQTLIKQYESIIEKFLPTDKSLSIIGTFIALICLQGFSQPLFYRKYLHYQALPLAINRLKRTWFYLKRLDKNKNSLKSEVETIINVFFSQSNQSIEQHITFSLACAAAWKKLDIGDTSDWLKFEILRTKNVSQYFKFQPEFVSSIERSNAIQIVQNIPSLQIFHQKLIFLLSFIPQSLQQLYYRMTITSSDTTDSLPLVVLLSQCLILLETLTEVDENLGHALSTLQSLFKEYMLKNYAAVLFGEQWISRVYPNIRFKDVFKNIDDMISKKLLVDRPIDWETLINTERQRIDYAKSAIQNPENDLKLYVPSISLDKVFQGQYCFHHSQQTRYTNISSDEGAVIHSATVNIHDSVLRIIALSIILEMKNPSIFNYEQEEQLQGEMICQLENLIPNLSLLKSSLLFIRCYPVHSSFSASFKLMANIIGEKLTKTPIDKQTDDEEAAFIALRQLNNTDPFSYLL
ncbi:unnamed protein product [Rotaria sp. Silwood2]|nr:unnamed protein product [Rotaria sp. Silwood2]